MKIQAMVNDTVEVDIELSEVIDAMLSRWNSETVREVMMTINNINGYLSKIPDDLIAAHAPEHRAIIGNALRTQAARWLEDSQC